jgi:excisionase family DNA binding protein
MKIADFFYTEAQAAQILKVNRITIWRRIKAGEFNAQKIGGTVIIPKYEVDLLKLKTTEN